jgi:hypothetical protein
MTSQDFPSCCAITLLTDFGNTETALDTTHYTKDEVDWFLKEKIKQNWTNTGLMAVLNSDQHKSLISVFRKNGFKQKSKFYFSGHKQHIYVMLRLTKKNDNKK